jgi:catechol 2,3-dioxygenase-like lactoylglutathione lyase family enzyme
MKAASFEYALRHLIKQKQKILNPIAMQRLHINIHVNELEANIRFYSQLFKAEPSVQKVDYAKWMLDNPCVNFSLSKTEGKAGIEHLGIQVEDSAELTELFGRLDAIEGKQFREGDTVCCYAKSEKSWIEDPQGIEWEIFRTYGVSETYREDSGEQHSACCTPKAEETACCSPQEADRKETTCC